jgi:CBS domain-containing protein
MQTEVATCAPSHLLRSLRPAGPGGSIVVVNDRRVVLGILRGADRDPDASAEDVMDPAPATFRPNIPLAGLAEYMAEHNLREAPITTSEGVLLGMLQAEEARRAADGHEHVAAGRARPAYESL